MNYKFKKRSNVFIMFVCFMLLMVMSFSSAGCGYLVDEDQAIRAVSNMGFTDVKIENRHVFFLTFRGCSESDKAGFTVSGRNP